MKAIKDDKTGRWSLEGVEDDSITFYNMVENLKQGKNFKFARYGDGELFCMNGKIGRNCDQHEYFPELGARLIDTVQHKMDYMVGIQPLSVNHLPHLVDQFILKTYTPKELYNADTLHNASIDGKINVLLHAIEMRYVILVGPAHLAALFDEMVHIVIPNLNAWLEYDQVKKELQYHIEGSPDPVVLLCCGMMAEVLIYDLATTKATIIDAGSLFDPYCGVNSRSYHYKLNK